MGLRADSSALVIVHQREAMLRVAEIVELRPSESAPLKPSAVVRRFASVMARHGCTYAVGDSHYVESVREYLNEFDMSLVPGPSPPSEAYVRTRQLMREGRVRVPRHQRLIAQLREVTGRPTAGGGLSIQHPRWARGGHGDLCAAFVLAVWHMAGDIVAEPKAVEGTREAEQARKKARYEHFKAEADRPFWKANGGAADRGPSARWRR